MATKVTINLTDGRQMRLVVFEDAAPKTAANFLKLCRQGFYEGLCFHRVIPNFMIQGGGFECCDGQLHQKTSETVEGEFAANKFENPVKHRAGTLSMARAQDKNSASCQFFICVDECAYLDGYYAGFGGIADDESLKVAKAISEVKTGKWMAYDDVPVEPVIIKSVTVE